MQKENFFQKATAKKLKLGKPRIGFGLVGIDKEILTSLRKSKKYADIVLVGPKAITRIKGFEKIISDNPEQKLAEMLANGEVEGIVRGTIDDFKAFEAYQGLVGKNKTKDMIELALLEDAYSRQFFISEASNPLGWTKEEKIERCKGIIKFIKEELGVKPKIGLITGVRHGTYARRKSVKKGVMGILNQTYKDAEEVVKYFKKRKIQIKNYAIELNAAVEDNCNIIVPQSGMVGNQIFRALCLIGGGKILACSRANLPHYYEDNSRCEKDFEPHIKWLVAWINGKKIQKLK